MLTEDKTITTAEYWDGIISGKRKNAVVDSSNGKRSASFDRFGIVADIVEGPNVIEAAAGHARISSLIKSKHNDWYVAAFDQSIEAKKASGFIPYIIGSVYDIPCTYRAFDTLICTQAFEYFEDLPKALAEFKRVAKKGVFTFPRGEMSSWSQLYIFTPESVTELLKPYGEIEVFTAYEHLILVKIIFNEV